MSGAHHLQAAVVPRLPVLLQWIGNQVNISWPAPGPGVLYTAQALDGNQLISSYGPGLDICCQFSPPDVMKTYWIFVSTNTGASGAAVLQPPTPPQSVNLKQIGNGYILAKWHPTDPNLQYLLEAKCGGQTTYQSRTLIDDCEHKFHAPKRTLPYSVSVSAKHKFMGGPVGRKTTGKEAIVQIDDDVFVDFSKSLRKNGFGVYEGYIRGGTAVYDVGPAVGWEKVALKLVEVSDQRLWNREIMLSRVARHLNTILYLSAGQISGSEKSFFVAMELCRKETLFDMVTRGGKLPNDQIKTALYHLMTGLSHLHGMGIVHRDLHPGNILFSLSGRYLKIADFDHCKQLDPGSSYVSVSRLPSGNTQDWRAPEVKEIKSKFSVKSDVYSAGLIFIFSLSRGAADFHPQKMSLLDIPNNVSIRLEHFDDRNSACFVILNMLAHESSDRPTAEAVLNHFFFWNAEKRLDFFSKMKTYLHKFAGKEDSVAATKTTQEIVKYIKQRAPNDWANSLQLKLLETNFDKYNILVEKAGETNKLRSGKVRRMYETQNVFHLIRFIRNIYTHYADDDKLRKVFKSSEDVWQVVDETFPELLIDLHSSVYEYWPTIADNKDFPADAGRFFSSQDRILDLPMESTDVQS